jgi:hypothetical protein
MATRTLVDGATNLSLTASWSGTTLPVDGDTAIIPRGSQHISTLTGLSGVNLARLEVAFSGRIESAAGAGWAIDVDSTSASEAIITSRGATLKFAGGTSKKWEITKVRAPGSTITFTDGEWEDLFVESVSQLTLDPSVVVDTYRQYGGNVWMGENATVVTDGKVYGGAITIRRGGTWRLHGNTTVILDIRNGATTTIYTESPGVTLIHKNGGFNGELNEGQYIDSLEEPATIGGTAIQIGPHMRISATNRVTFSNVTQIGVERSLAPV